MGITRVSQLASTCGCSAVSLSNGPGPSPMPGSGDEGEKPVSFYVRVRRPSMYGNRRIMKVHAGRHSWYISRWHLVHIVVPRRLSS